MSKLFALFRHRQEEVSSGATDLADSAPSHVRHPPPPPSIDTRSIKELEVFYDKLLAHDLKKKEATFRPKKSLKDKKRWGERKSLQRLLCDELVSIKLFGKIFDVFASKTKPNHVEIKHFFIGLLACCDGSTDHKLLLCFSIFDEDKDGFLTREEATEMLETIQKIDLAHERIMRSTSTLLSLSKHLHSSPPQHAAALAPVLPHSVDQTDEICDFDSPSSSEQTHGHVSESFDLRPTTSKASLNEPEMDCTPGTNTISHRREAQTRKPNLVVEMGFLRPLHGTIDPLSLSPLSAQRSLSANNSGTPSVVTNSHERVGANSTFAGTTKLSVSARTEFAAPVKILHEAPPPLAQPNSTTAPTISHQPHSPLQQQAANPLVFEYQNENILLRSHSTERIQSDENGVPAPLQPTHTSLSQENLGGLATFTNPGDEGLQHMLSSKNAFENGKISMEKFLRWIHTHPSSLLFLSRLQNITCASNNIKFNHHLIAEERDLIRRLFATMRLQANDECYLLSTKWWRLWKDYVETNVGGGATTSNFSLDVNPSSGSNRHGESEKPTRNQSAHDVERVFPPGSIDNQDLLDVFANDVSSVSGFPILRANLLERVDFIAVDAIIWRMLVSWYGGGPVIIRRVVDLKGTGGRLNYSETMEAAFALSKDAVGAELFPSLPSTLRIDLHPLVLRVGHFSTRVVVSHCICSSSNNANDLAILVAIQLNIPAASFKTRLWTVIPGVEPIPINDVVLSLHDLGLTSSSIVLLQTHSKSASVSPANSFFQGWSFSTSSFRKSIPSNQNLVVGGLSAFNLGTGRIGLRNMGNTCFLNAALQSLVHVMPLVEYFLHDHFKQDFSPKAANDGEIVREFVALLKQLWASKQPFSTGSCAVPHKLRSALIRKAKQFGGNDQHDAQEFLGYLLDHLHMELNHATDLSHHENPDFTDQSDEFLSSVYWLNHLRRESSIVVSLFQGQFKSHTYCLACRHEIIKFHPFLFLSLPLPEENYRVISFTLFLLDVAASPTRCRIRINRTRTVYDLITAVRSLPLMDLHACHFVVTDIQRHYIYSILRMSRPLSDIRERDEICVHEIEKHSNQHFNSTVNIALISQSIISSASSGDGDGEKPHNQSPPSTSHSDFNSLSQANPHPPLKNINASHKHFRIELIHFLSNEMTPTATRFPLLGHPLIMTIPVMQMEGRRHYLTNGALLYQQVFDCLSKYLPLFDVWKSLGNEDQPIDADSLFQLRFTTNNGIRCTKNPCDCALLPCSGCLVASNQEDRNNHEKDRNNHEKDQNNQNGESNQAVELDNLEFNYDSFAKGAEWDDDAVRQRNGFEVTDGSCFAVEWLPQCRSVEAVKILVSHLEYTVDHSSVTDSSLSPDSMALSDILKEYEKPEFMNNKDFYCSHCQSFQEGIKRETVWRLPSILIIQLKRFSFDSNGFHKNHLPIHFPTSNFDFAPFLTKNAEGAHKHLGQLLPLISRDNHHPPLPSSPTRTPSVSTSLPASSDVFDLISIIYHQGGFDDGHYFTEARNQFTTTWTCFNDDQTSQCGEKEGVQVSANAYVFMYQRRNLQPIELLQKQCAMQLTALEVRPP